MRGDDRKHQVCYQNNSVREDICWGRMPVLSLLENDPTRILRIYLSKTMQPQMYKKITEYAKKSSITFVVTNARDLDAMSDGENHQGVIAVISGVGVRSMTDVSDLAAKSGPALAIVFDHLEDPHNVGALIRTAEAFGASFAVLPTRRGALPAGTVAKTSAGASLRFPIIMTPNVREAIKRLKELDFWCVGLDMSGTRSLSEAGMMERAAIVVGAEGKGLSTVAASECDECLKIPMKGTTGSLNASSAGAIAMYEWSRSLLSKREEI